VRAMLAPCDQLRLQRGATHLHHLGPRCVAKFLAEIAGDVGGMAAVLHQLGEDERITLEMGYLVGGDRFPPRPLLAVPR
jgi:hypothetical protein